MIPILYINYNNDFNIIYLFSRYITYYMKYNINSNCVIDLIVDLHVCVYIYMKYYYFIYLNLYFLVVGLKFIRVMYNFKVSSFLGVEFYYYSMFIILIFYCGRWKIISLLWAKSRTHGPQYGRPIIRKPVNGILEANTCSSFKYFWPVKLGQTLQIVLVDHVRHRGEILYSSLGRSLKTSS